MTRRSPESLSDAELCKLALDLGIHVSRFGEEAQPGRYLLKERAKLEESVRVQLAEKAGHKARRVAIVAASAAVVAAVCAVLQFACHGGIP